MLFNSYEFIFLFLPFTFFTYFYLNKKRLTEVAKGFWFYRLYFFTANVIYLPLILGSMVFNYCFGVELNKENSKISKKFILILGIVANLMLLGYFKYSDFFISNLNFIFHTQIPHLNLLLPLAISFFTFQQIAYLVDSAMGGVRSSIAF